MLTSDVEKIINKPPALWAADRTREPLTDASVRCASV
jgi:hypothetical protein